MQREGKWRRIRRLFGADPQREVDDEITFHLEMRTRERVEAGADAGEAREQALHRFGDVAATRAETLAVAERRARQARHALYASELRQDVVYALRSLARRPGFAAVAIATLGLGIGANSAIFSVVRGVLLESLPFRAASELMLVETHYSNNTSFPLSRPDFASVLEENRVFSSVAALAPARLTITAPGEPLEVDATWVSKGLFELLGIAPVAGRTFVAEEHAPGAGNVAVLTAGFAERYFGSARNALQQTLTLRGQPFTVVGVMQPGTEAPEQTQLYIPLPYDSTVSATAVAGRRAESLTVIGRMRAGVTPGAVESDVRRIGTLLEARFPNTNGNLTFTSVPLIENMVGDVREPLLILLGAVALVLLVACANVANLLLARASVREGELAVRAALGAGRARLIRQLLTESVVLAGAGALVGLIVAWVGTRALINAQPADIPRLSRIGVDGVVIAFTAGIALLTGLLFGTLPALQATSARLLQSLREGGRGAVSGLRGQRIRGALVVSELALAVVLLVGAGLLIRSFLELTRVDLGFQTDNAITFRLSLQTPAYNEPDARRRFFNELSERIRAIPGVTHAGGATALPMSGGELFGPFNVDGREVPAGVLPEIRVVNVTPEYVAALGAPLLKGRMLNAYDDADAPLVVLFNRAAIARWFPDGDPVGERIDMGGTLREVVGLVGDVVQTAPNIPIEPEMYVPYAQRTGRTLRFVVRGQGDMSAIASRIRSEVRAMDAQLPLTDIDPLARVFNDAVARPRFYTTLLTLFAAVALTLAVVGIFGVMSYVVTQRAREISIRMALGANRSTVIGMVVGSAMKIAAAGLAIGVAGALWLGRLLENQLFGITPRDPATLVAVLVLLGGSAATASFLPARRAAALDPGSALRDG